MTIEFEEFFEAVWGYEPYPWQVELSKTVCRNGTWPRVLDLPTGSGKTAVLDIALHHLIVDDEGVAPRRMIVVVDRRVIVDQVGQRAQRILSAIGDESSDRDPRDVAVLRLVRNRLEAIAGERAPLLHTEVLRGGTVRSDAWAAYPHVPVLAASTVDQVGSRLFFRGYGVSDRMRPIHAGLLGCDTLLFLDEVHLSRPFADVLEQLMTLRGNGSPSVPQRFGVVQLSATPGRRQLPGNDARERTDGDLPDESVLRLQAADRDHAVLARVLGASKPATLEVVNVRLRSPESTKRQAMAERVATHARRMVGAGHTAVAVVVNRVDTARRCWGLLQDDAFDCVLLTGRMRPLDQAAISTEIGQRVAAGRERSPNDRPIVVVATQCIEAGADYDFDALVTECASLDALRQRFGRLDRRGDLSATADTSDRENNATVLIRSDQLGRYTDPVYQDALVSTWTWLQAIATDGAVDFGISALEPHISALGESERLADLLAPSPPAPVLLPAYLDQWCQTNPRPHADPEVSYFLHGIPPDLNRVQADVQVVWRADLTEHELQLANSRAIADRIAMVPPGSMEAISLPLWAVKQWLGNGDEVRDTDDIADLEGVATASPDEDSERLVFCWRGRDSSQVSRVKDVAPGDTIVVPVSYGGIGIHGTFDPAATGVTARVTDLGDLVQLRQRGRPTLRLDERVIGVDVAAAIADLFPDEEAESESVPSARSVITTVRQTLQESPQHEWMREVLDALEARIRLIQVPSKGKEGGSTGSWMIVGSRVKPDVSGQRLLARYAEASIATADSPEDESFTGSSTYLDDHLKNVGRMAEEFAQASGLPDELVAAIRIAGDVHDIGKVDRRFQVLLNGGDEIAARFGKPLAKSAVTWQDVATRNRAQQLAGYPRGQRHELVSLDMVERSVELRARVEEAGADWDLVLHLIASHHGWCRPFAPISSLEAGVGESVKSQAIDLDFCGTTDHRRAKVNSGVTKRFHDLVRRYGWYELAFLEAILRLADHRQSELEVMRG